MLLFTDTLGDVNGVSRFVQNISKHASERGFSGWALTPPTTNPRQDHHAFCAISSTRFEVPISPNIRNFDPQLATSMPGYANLELALPPADEVMEFVRSYAPDVIHVSTPGPVGWLGRNAAKKLGVPLLGTYHTDFPAYVDQLFGFAPFTRITRSYIRAFYKPFHRILSRSDQYIAALTDLGYPAEQISTLKAGICLEDFSPNLRDDAWFADLTGLDESCFKCLYVGRLSVEKNLPFLVELWPQARERCQQLGLDVALVVVGDGPYGQRMRQALSSPRERAVFLGFQSQPHLSRMYASCDLFVFPSMTDTLGQVVMESQASGLPAIVSDIGGPASMVKDGQTGRVVPCDVEAWVESILTYAQSRQRTKHEGQRAHELMQSHSIQASFDAFWELHYLEYLQSKSKDQNQ